MFSLVFLDYSASSFILGFLMFLGAWCSFLAEATGGWLFIVSSSRRIYYF